MPFNALSAGINATSALTTTLMNNAATRRNNKKNYEYTQKLNKQLFDYQNVQDARANQYNREMLDKQYAMNLAQWNRENEYNSPAAQMERFKKAGLNPNLIYGQQNTSASSPSYGNIPGQFNTAPQSLHQDVAMRYDGFAQLGSVLAEYQDLRSKKLDNDIKEATKDDVIANAFNTNLSSRYGSEIEYLRLMHDLHEVATKYGVDKVIPFDIPRDDNKRAFGGFPQHGLPYGISKKDDYIKENGKDLYTDTFTAFGDGISLGEIIRDSQQTSNARQKAQLAGDEFLAEVYKAKTGILNRLVDRDKDGNVNVKTLLDPSLHNELKTLDMIINNSSLYNSVGDILGVLTKFLNRGR